MSFIFCLGVLSPWRVMEMMHRSSSGRFRRLEDASSPYKPHGVSKNKMRCEAFVEEGIGLLYIHSALFFHFVFFSIMLLCFFNVSPIMPEICNVLLKKSNYASFHAEKAQASNYATLPLQKRAQLCRNKCEHNGYKPRRENRG